MADVRSTSGTATLLGHPQECPFCHHKITPLNVFGYRNGTSFDVLQQCPNSGCRKSFIAYYDTGTHNTFSGHTTVGSLVAKEFSETISTISTAFVAIYNQAYSAEQQNLTEICGVGYRKALEFLIKDYLIKITPADTEKIEKKLLGPCINDLVDDKRIKSVAKRAVWLGNDETHYVRKWEGKNLDDLKKLIELTVHWIEMEALTQSFEADMPDQSESPSANN